MKNILLLHGPNLNMLGQRDPEKYGTDTLADIEALCHETGKKHDMAFTTKQSNHEGVLVDEIQAAIGKIDGLIINAGAYTHTSIAIHDALELLNCPIIEVHLSDPEAREEFRHKSFITPLAHAVVKGKKAQGYIEAIEILSKT